MYYCTKDWKDEHGKETEANRANFPLGGAFVDVEANDKKFVPEFNSLVLFKVPRRHYVEPVTQSDFPRYSVFGWFLDFERKLTEEDLVEGVDQGGY